MSDETVQVSLNLPPGSIVIRSVEVVQFLSPEGEEAVACRWQGDRGNVLVELGMCEYAKQEIIQHRWSDHSEDQDDTPPTQE